MYFLDTKYPCGKTAEMQSFGFAAFECDDSGMWPAQWMELSAGWLSWVAAPGINWCQDSRSECGKFGCDYGECDFFLKPMVSLGELK